MDTNSSLEQDLNRVLEWVGDDLRSLRGARLFITGGTGFIGTWLLETLLWANERLALDAQIVVLTRSPEDYARSAPQLAANPAIALVKGDVRRLPPDLGIFDGIIHAATPASAALNRDDPALMLSTIVDGGRAVLDLAAQSGPIPYLFTSSGAVYGRQPEGLSHVSEDYLGGPDPLSTASAYHEGKRVGELQCALAHKAFGLKAKIARIYALVGPNLPLDIHFAMGNFIGDILAGRTVTVQGDGTTVRSYLYAADMAAWLWAVFVRGTPLRAYNVGSERAIDMAELAPRVEQKHSAGSGFKIMGVPEPGKAIDRYVPCTRRAREELRLAEWTSLDDAISSTIAHARLGHAARPSV